MGVSEKNKKMTGEGAKRSRYYTPNEVALHNTPNDLWVSFLGKVFDLTVLVENNKGNELIAPILAVAGQDISHWFNSRTGDIKTHVDAEKGITKYYCPHGRFLHVPPAEPRSDYSTDFGRPWWRDAKYEVTKHHKDFVKIKFLDWIINFKSSSLETDKYIDLTTTYDRSL